MENIDRGDKVCIVIDSIGNLASKKELEDALNDKSVADMSRAKALKGLFRMVTPYLTMKNVPLLAVNHTYQEIGLFPKAVVSGGTGIYYSADNIWIIGRKQEKQGTEIKGYHFIINVEKSRFVKKPCISEPLKFAPSRLVFMCALSTEARVIIFSVEKCFLRSRAFSILSNSFPICYFNYYVDIPYMTKQFGTTYSCSSAFHEA